MMALRKVKGPDAEGREAMYYADRQEFAYQQGAYQYLQSIGMVPRLAVIAGYIKALGLTRILDVGCGTGELLAYLHPSVTYIGIDISPTAIATARQHFSDRPQTQFVVADFRQWNGALDQLGSILDGVVWAGIGCAWTHKGRGGSANDWAEILALAERPLQSGGYLIFELVTAHWGALERLMGDRYDYETGCDLDCFQSEESPKRSIRVLKKKVLEADVSLATSSSAQELFQSALLQPLIATAHRMGQLTDESTSNLGFGYLYYGLTRIYQPNVVVCIGSYRGFMPICCTLGLRDNQKGICYFIDPGKVDRFWHDAINLERLEQQFGIRGRWQYLRQTSQQAIATSSLPDVIDLLIIDGDHSYTGVKFDFDEIGRRVRAGGIILLHDSISEGKGFTNWEVKRFLETEVQGHSDYETFTIPLAAGLTLVRKLQ